MSAASLFQMNVWCNPVSSEITEECVFYVASGPQHLRNFLWTPNMSLSPERKINLKKFVEVSMKTIP